MWRKPDRGNDCDCGCGCRARGRDPRLGSRIGRSSWLLGLLSPAGHKKGAAVTAAPVGRTLKEVGELHRLGSLCAAVDFRPRRPRGRARAFRVHPPMPSLSSMSSWASGYIIWPSFMGSPSSWAAAALAVSAARRGGQHRKGVPLRPGRLVFLNQLGAHHASDGAARDVRMPVVMLLGNVRVRHGAIHPHVGDGIAVAVGAGVGLRAVLPGLARRGRVLRHALNTGPVLVCPCAVLCPCATVVPRLSVLVAVVGHGCGLGVALSSRARASRMRACRSAATRPFRGLTPGATLGRMETEALGRTRTNRTRVQSAVLHD